MIILFTDFGVTGPYVGQLRAVLAREAPGVSVVELFSDAPACNPRAAAYLLPAYVDEFPEGSVFLTVVDPGVGSAERAPVVMRADGRWFVGPGNGLLDVVARRARESRWWEIQWRPERLSATFHGRDLFAPVAARLARGGDVPGRPLPPGHSAPDGWPEDLPEVVYVDGFGNGMTGMRASHVDPDARLRVEGTTIARARTYAESPPGSPFWYENANGLVEVGLAGGSAAASLGLGIGTPVGVIP